MNKRILAAAEGGAIDNASVVAANGMLFVQSGYGLMGVPGNLLFAFRRAESRP